MQPTRQVLSYNLDKCEVELYNVLQSLGKISTKKYNIIYPRNTFTY